MRKKILLSFLCTFFACVCFGNPFASPNLPKVFATQDDSCDVTSIPWFESFENALNCWTLIDADGDGNNWFSATGVPNSGTYSVASYSYNTNWGGAVVADNWLVSPAITLPAQGDIGLVFNVRCGNSDYPDSIKVMVTTGAGTSTSDFTTTLIPLTSISTENYQQLNADLSAYNGQTIRLAFIHQSYDGLWISLDDISLIYVGETYTINLLSSDTTMGTVTGGGTYSAGDAVVLMATANEGYRFTGWSDGYSNNPRQFVAAGNMNLTAYFANLGDSVRHYDNGIMATTIGRSNGGSYYWGIRFPAGELEDFNWLTGVRIWNSVEGDYELRIYSGGDDAPGTLVYSEYYYLEGGDIDWFNAELSTAVTLNHTQPLWIVFHTDGLSYPAAASNYAGTHAGSWSSATDDGEEWGSIANAGLYYTWMIRAVLSNTTPDNFHSLTVLSANTNMGTVSGSGLYPVNEAVSISATALPGYRFTGWSDGSTVNPRTVYVHSDTTFTANFADLGDVVRHYDNGTFSTTIGAGGTLSWGIRFPEGTLSGHDSLYQVMLIDQYEGSYTLSIYQGGVTAPESLIATQVLTLTGSQDWHTATLNTPIPLNHTQPLWVVFHNEGVNYPAVGSDYAGNPDGSWVSVNGVNWNSICDYNLNYTWMIRVVLESPSNITHYALTVLSSDTTMGVGIGSGDILEETTASISAEAFPGYRFTGWNDDNTENPRSITLTSDTTFIASFADLGDSVLHYDNGTMVYSIGTGQEYSSYYWGIRLPASELTDYDWLTAVRIRNIYSGEYDVLIYKGGDNAPETLISENYYWVEGGEPWYEATLSSPVQVDHTQPLWIIFYNYGLQWPATASNYAGNPDGSWVSNDEGETWHSLCDGNLCNTWMIRAVLSNTTPPGYNTLTVLSSDTNMGVTSGSGIYYMGNEASISATALPGYRFTGWSDGSTANPRNIYVESDMTLTANFANLGDTVRHYDNGVVVSTLGNGPSTFYWGIRFPEGTLAGHDSLYQVMVMDYYYVDNCELLIYQGGDTAPNTLIASQTFCMANVGDWYTITLQNPIALNHTQPLWIVLHTENAYYPAAYTNYAGNLDGSWLSLDGGENWNSLCDYNYYCTWMIRAVLELSEPLVPHTLTVQSANTNMGGVAGTGQFYGTYNALISANALTGYRFTGWNDSVTTNPRVVSVYSDTTFTAYFDDLGDTVRHYDNGTLVNTIGTSGEPISWGIRFPEGTLSGHDSLFKVMMYSYYSGSYDLAIYQGGDTVPGSLIANKTVSLPSSYDWELITLDNPIALNHTQPLWIVFHTEDIIYPATASDYAGTPDGSWVSEDGVEWDFVGDFGLNVTFMIRAVLEDIVPFTFYNITAQSADISMGTVSGDTVVRENHYATLYATALPGYRFVGWNDGSFENPHYVLATEDMVLTAYFADLGGSEHHYDNGVKEYSMVMSYDSPGIRFLAGELSDYDTLSGIRIWNVAAEDLELLVYTGGENMPSTLVYTQNVTLTGGDSTWFDVQLTTPIVIDHTQPLWIFLQGNSDDIVYPASRYAGNPEGSWVGYYGIYWYTYTSVTWMIRAMLTGGEIDHYYTVTATSSNPDHGHVIGGGTFLEGSMVGLLAEASPHYHFTQWSDGSTANPRIFIVTCDTTFTAHFAADMYTITVESMQPEMGTVTPSNSYAYGTVIQIEANPYSGYEFVSWNDANTDNPRTLVVTGDSTFIAQFQPYTGIEDLTSAEVQAYCVDGQIVVTGVSGMSVDILDMTGKLVARAQASDADRQVFKVTATGIYMVRTGNGTVLKVPVVR